MARRVGNPASNLCRSITLMLGAVLSTVSLSPPAFADQNAPELPGLFDRLQNAEKPIDVVLIEQQIWGHWLEGPDETSTQLMSQIQIALQSGQNDFGLKLSNQLIDAYPDFAEGWNKRATLFYLMNRFEDSVADIQKTLDLEPNHFGALAGLGLILMRTGDAQGAVQAFEEVLKISPASPSAEANAAQARDQLGTDI